MVDDKINPQPLQPEEAPPQLSTAPQPTPATPLTSVPPEPHSDSIFKYFFVIGAVLVFIVIFGLLFAFFARRSSSQEKVNLTYWGVWEDSNVLQSLITEYQSKHKNVSITYTKMSPQDYREKLIARTKNGNGPDLFRFHNTWVPEMREIMAVAPSTVITPGEFKKTFYPIHSSDLIIADQIYGIPLYIDGLVLFYNDDLFKKAGMSSAPVSWEDVLDATAKLTVKNPAGQIVTSGIALGTASNIDHFSDIFGLFLLQNGGDITQLSKNEAAGALESYRRFAEADAASWDEQMPNSVQAFAQAKVAMIIAPSWEAMTIKSINPDLSFKVVPVPVIPGSRPVSVATYWVEGVSRYSKQQIEAWKFLRFLTEKSSQEKLFEQQSKVRLFGGAYARKELGSLLSSHPYLGPVVKQAQTDGGLRTVPSIDRTYDNGLNDAVAGYIRNAINETIQGVSYEQALATADQGVTQVLTNFRMIPASSK